MSDQNPTPSRPNEPAGDDDYASALDRTIAAADDEPEHDTPKAPDQPPAEGGFQLLFEELTDSPPEPAAGKERNRNLSAIVDTIEDEGPARPAREPAPSAPTRPRRPAPPPARPAPEQPAAAPTPPEAPSRLPLHLALALAGVALLAAVALGFTSAGLGQRLAAVEANARQPAEPNDDPRFFTMETELRRLRTALTTLQEQANVPPPAAEEPPALDTLRDRLATLEDGLAAATARLDALEATRTPPKAASAKPAPKPATPSGKSWSVNLITMGNQVAANRLQEKYRKSGVEAEVQPVTVDGKTLYRLRVPGFDSADSAKKFAADAKSRLGLKDLWVTRD